MAVDFLSRNVQCIYEAAGGNEFGSFVHLALHSDKVMDMAQ